MTQKQINPFDEFYCMSADDSRIAFALREIYQTFNDKTRVDRKSLHKFGGNPSVGTLLEPVNSWGEFEEYQASNIVLNMSSTDDNDSAMVTIEYMYFDESDNLVFGSQTQTLTGQTPIALPVAACRWTRMFTSSNVGGDVYIYRGTATNGQPNNLANVHCAIPAGSNQSQKAATSIAGSNYLILTYGWADTIRKSSSSVEVGFRIRQIGNDFRVAPRRGASSDNSISYVFDPYIIIPPNSDVEVVARAESGTDNNVTAGFDGYFADIISGVV
jgi:hypothetical protein